jgi:hypothetical protein
MNSAPSAADIHLPDGGGAIRGIDEAPSANPATGAGQVTFRIPAPAGRMGFGPALTLQYDSGGATAPLASASI